MRSIKIVSVNVFPTTDVTLPAFDNTKLVAINTCPTWGIIRYTDHKTFAGHGRAMALEAGGAAHEVFAAHRLYTFREFGAEFYRKPDHYIENVFRQNGNRIFGPERFDEMLACVNAAEDFRVRMYAFTLQALYNCGFYDDPDDKRRTTTNIEEMCLAYMDKYDWRTKLPVLRHDGMLGIEIPVDVTLEIVYNDGRSDHTMRVRLIGKADAIHWTDNTCTEARVHENKTASRLGDAWEQSWDTNHQPTGYMIALSTLFSQQIHRAEIYGTCLPLPRAYAVNGLSRVVAHRPKWMMEEWFQWFVHTVLLHDEFRDEPLDAPRYTHSCNRYFRPCSFIPLCGSPPDERQEMYNEMVTEEWSPLHGAGEFTDE